MRVLHAVHNYPPEFVGGTEAYVVSLCAAQRRRSDEVAVVAGSERAGPEVGREEYEGTPVLRLHHDPAVERYSVELRIDRLQTLFSRVVDEWRPDVVHVHHYLNLGIPMVALAAAAGVRSVVSLHDFTCVCPRFFLIRPDGAFCGDETPIPRRRCLDCCGAEYAGDEAALAREFDAREAFYADELTRAAAVLTPSARHARYLRETGLLPAVPVRALPLGLLRPLHPVSRVEDRDGRLRLVFFGNIAPVKGVEWLLQAVASLEPSRRDRVSVLLLGKITDEALGARIRAFEGSVRMRHEPSYDMQRLNRLPAEADLAVFPGAAAETYSLVVDEALALGLPLIVADRGAAAERAGDAAWVVKTGDVSALSAAIVSLFEDRGRLDTMRRAAGGLAFTIDEHAAELDSIYRVDVPTADSDSSPGR